jgi:Rhodopirellula transposase DDE domain
MELMDEVKELLIKTANELKGSARRLFMARTVRALGKGGQRRAEKALGWNRGLIRKGEHELKSRQVCVDAFKLRGRKRSEEHLPNLLKDITTIVDGQSQADPQFRSTRLYTRLTAAEVRRQLITTFYYTDAELPTETTITTKLNALGYSLKKVAKTQPQKNSQKRTPSSITSSRSTRRLMRKTRPYVSRWTPKRRSKSVPLHEEERTAC